MNIAGLILAFMMGLTGSIHCAGMCGPIMLILPFRHLSGFKKVLGITLYHAGRISIYATIGVLLFSFRALFHPEWQQYISIFTGGTLLVAGILSFFPKYGVVKLPWTGFVKQQLSKAMATPAMLTFLLTGMLNGLLPCGLVYMALSAAVSSTTVLQSALLMYAFGIGTLPMLIGITVIGNGIRISASWVKKLVPVAMLFFGCLFIIRGMNLGIPFLSPKMMVAPTHIKVVCCHKY